MSALPLAKSSRFTAGQIEQFLLSQAIPLRLSCNTSKGYPLLSSLWFFYERGSLFCATHERAALASHLKSDTRCAFEVAVNEAPYKGVRGQGRAHLERADADKTLGRLIDRYLGHRQSELAVWLLGRADEEYVIRIVPTWISSWDYSARMQK